MPLFWGPVFPDGYNASQVRRLLTQVVDSMVSGDAGFFGPPQTLDIKSKKDDDNCMVDPKLYMFANERDFAFAQLPAEVGVNASFWQIRISHEVFLVLRIFEIRNAILLIYFLHIFMMIKAFLAGKTR